MKQFLKYVLATVTGIVLVLIVVGILGAISLVGLAAKSAGSTQVEENSVYTLKLSGMLEERAANNPLAELTGQVSDNLGLDDLLTAIRKAKENEDVKGIYIEAGAFSSDTPASAHAIREALLDFKKSGKWIVAYGDSYTQTTYYICSAADKVYLNPEGMLDWHGLGGESYYIKDLLAKFGVKFQAVKVGKYKSAVEMMTADQMSDYDREQTEAYLNGIWKVMLDDVSKSRKVSVDSLNAYADQLVTFAEQKELVNKKLVDKLMYTDEVKGEIKKLLKIDEKDHINQLTLSEMQGVKGKKKEGEEVAIYYAYGDIVDSETDGLVNEEHSIVANEVCKDLEKLMNDDDVKAVVLRVNSPGGSAYASEQIWHSVAQLKTKKPVVVSMGGYAASGGYYISCNSNWIVAEPTTLTGSIGIFGMIPSLEDVVTDKVGVTLSSVKTNTNADFGTIMKSLTPAQTASLQNMINRGYELFTSRCAQGRHVSQDSIKTIAEGRVWDGITAKQIGLVDEFGGLAAATKWVAKKAGLKEDCATQNYPSIETDWRTMLRTAMQASYEARMRKEFGVLYDYHCELTRILQRSHMLCLMPEVEIN